MIENKKVFIFGMARSGYNIAKLLAPKNEILITDAKDQDPEKVKELENLGCKFVQIDNPIDLLDDSFDIVVKNPGIFQTNEVILKANSLNIPVVNEMEVAYHYLPKNIKIVGVTGSNGKTTTTTICYELLKKSGISVVLGGNIGYPLSEVIYKVKDGDVLLLEISDHQLVCFKDFKTDISILTNICPTHLDFHGTYDAYKQAKKRIFEHHTQDNLAIINANNEVSLELTKDIASTKKYFCGNDAYIKDDIIYVDNEEIINTKDILVKGEHNYENIMAALLLLKEFGISKDKVKEVLQNFKGVEHRIEFVDKINGVSYYNDSKATNPTSTITAIKAFDGNIHLILGGMQRSQDFHELDDVISRVKRIYAIGEVTDEILEYANSVNIPCEKCYVLKDAFNKTQEYVEDGDVVLLSPASASWDQYEKFEDRGDEFKNYCKEITKII